MICLHVFDRTIAESKKKHEEKQLKAQQLRDKLREEKSLKLQKLLERVSERASGAELTENAPQKQPKASLTHIERFCQHAA